MPSSRPRSPRTWPTSGRPRADRRTRSCPAARGPRHRHRRGACLAYGYGLGSLRRPGPGLWPFAVSVLIVVLAVVLLVVGRHLDDAEKFTRSSLLVARRRRDLRRPRPAAPGHRLRDPGHPARHRLAALPRRRVLAQHDRHLGRHDRGVLRAVPLRPARSRCPTCSPSERREETPMDWNAFLDGFGGRDPTDQPALLPDRRRDRHAHRRAAGPRPGRHDGHPAADRLQRRRPGLGDHHARRHLLRRAVRRHDHLGPAPHPR